MRLAIKLKAPHAIAKWAGSLFAALVIVAGLASPGVALAQSQSYVSSSDTYSWIDASLHNRVRAYSPTYSYPGNSQPPPITFPRNAPPYFLYTPTGAISCGSSGTILDDRLSDEIPLGFTFRFAGVDFTKLRISSNGRIQFNNNLTCGSGTDNGTPTIYTYDYPDANMNYSMRIYGADLDPTPKSFSDGGVTKPVNPSYATVCQDDAQCYISVATIGSAPLRKFVVTWNNVPKWVNAGLIAGNFNLQIILEEGGDFVYQYGNVADSQPGVPAQIGWQVNTKDYDIKQTALPTNNSAIRYQVPRPIVQFQMEQPGWSTAPGQVIDTSGNNSNGSRLGGAQTTAQGYACSGASIPANASSATIDGIDTGLNLSNSLGSVGSISFWYKPAVWVGAAAAVNGQLLDATTVNGAWFYLSKLRVNNTTTKLRFAVQDSAGVTRTVETSAMTTSVLNDGWVFITVTWNFNSLAGTNQDRLRIYVNNVAIGTSPSKESAFSSSGALDPGINTLFVGDNRSSFIDGANGSGSSANGVIDEFRIYNNEVGYGQVLNDYTAPVGCASHYAITHAGTATPPVPGATCSPNPVAIAMHTASDALLQTSATITLSTTTNKGDWTLISGNGTLTNGIANDGIATYKFNNESQVVLALTHTIAGTVNFNVIDGTYSEQQSAAEDASLVINSCTVTGFNGCDYKAARCDPTIANYDRLITKLAGNAFTLDAVTLDSAGAVDTAFNQSVMVDLLANLGYTAPSATTNCPATQAATIGLGSIAFTNGRVTASGIPVSAATVSGVAPNYSAYGDVRMRFTCNPTDCPPSGLTVCSKDSFALRPSDFILTASTMTNTSVTTGTPKLTAGSQFPMTAQSRNTAGANASGYNGTPTIIATVAAQAVSAQATNAQVTLTDYTDRLEDANVNTVVLFNSASAATGLANASLFYLDYGGFRILTGGVRDNAYVSPMVDVPGLDCVANSFSNTFNANGLIGCVVANQANSALIGRFYPNSFFLTSSSTFPLPTGYVESTIVRNACTAGAFTYEDQGFPVINSFIHALSNGSVIPAAVLPRYTAGVFNLAAENNNDGVNLAARLALNLSPAPGWNNGSYAVNAPAVTFSRLLAPDGPFDALDIGVSMTDVTDSITLGNARNMLPTNATACTTSTCTHQKLTGSPIKMRFGRLRLQNAYGSERLALQVPWQVQYSNGTAGFVRNIADSCTALLAGNVSFHNQKAPVTAANVTVTAVTNPTAGEGIITLSAPNPGAGTWADIGSVDLILNLGGTTTKICPPNTTVTPGGTAAPFAFLATNSCGAASYVSNPTARAFFGVYKSPLIYRRENY